MSSSHPQNNSDIGEESTDPLIAEDRLAGRHQSTRQSAGPKAKGVGHDELELHEPEEKPEGERDLRGQQVSDTHHNGPDINRRHADLVPRRLTEHRPRVEEKRYPGHIG